MHGQTQAEGNLIRKALYGLKLYQEPSSLLSVTYPL